MFPNRFNQFRESSCGRLMPCPRFVFPSLDSRVSSCRHVRSCSYQLVTNSGIAVETLFMQYARIYAVVFESDDNMLNYRPSPGEFCLCDGVHLLYLNHLVCQDIVFEARTFFSQSKRLVQNIMIITRYISYRISYSSSPEIVRGRILAPKFSRNTRFCKLMGGLPIISIRVLRAT